MDKQHRLQLVKNKSVVEAYNNFFDRVFTASRWYEPEYVCVACSSRLKLWKSKNVDNSRTGMAFSSPMIWHHQTYHKVEDCYFCKTDVNGHHFKTRKYIKYANVLTVTKPLTVDDWVEPPAAEVEESHKFEDKADQCYTSDNKDAEFLPSGSHSKERHEVSNVEYQDLVRDLGLSRSCTRVFECLR